MVLVIIILLVIIFLLLIANIEIGNSRDKLQMLNNKGVVIPRRDCIDCALNIKKPPDQEGLTRDQLIKENIELRIENIAMKERLRASEMKIVTEETIL